MTKNPVLPGLEKVNEKVFFLFLFLFQLLSIFQGIDLSDEGFYATFYQQVFTHPETAQYNFMFWFSGIIGGAFNYLLPGLGLWGIRLAGVLVTTGTIIVTYHLLKKYMSPSNLKLGLLIVVLFINNNLKEFHYNNLSAFFNVLTIYFLLQGLKENKMNGLFLSGLIISLNTFSRIPNFLCLGLGLAIFYYGYQYKLTLKKQFLQLLVFGAGFVLMTAMLLLFMKMIGHLDIFLNSLQLLRNMGSGDEKSFYGPLALVHNFFSSYTISIKYTLEVLLLIGLGAFAISLFKKSPFYRSWIADGLKYLVLLLVCVLFVKGILDRDMLLYFFTGLTIIANLLVLFTVPDKDLRLLVLMGGFIFFTYPFTSSAGIYSAGIYSFWVSLPIAIDYVFNIRTIGGHFNLTLAGGTERGGFTIPDYSFQRFRIYLILVCIFGCLVYTYRFPFFDRHNRAHMTYPIDNKYLRGIFTSKERADAMNQLLGQMGKWVKPDDYLLAYQCIPMLNYITHTRPYMRNSYPWLYDAATFKRELYKGWEETKLLPVIVIQKTKTIGNRSDWPDSTAVHDLEWEQKNVPRNNCLTEFMTANRYREVWFNELFSIMLPPPLAAGKIPD